MSGDKKELHFTGERFVPGARGEIWVEHWHRYHFAARWVAGKRVLDVACGEGYGTALLAAHAAKATGADISEEAIAHARWEYASLTNAEFVSAPCTKLPLADASIDVAVSFETLEHIETQAEFLAELARVLTPEGVLVLSCPNKLEYSDKRDFANEFHVKELYREELAALLAVHFPHARWYGQRPSFFSVIAPEVPSAPEGELIEVVEGAPTQAAAHFTHPLYFLVVASRSEAAVSALPPAVSVLADREDWVHRDYEKVMRHLEESVKRGEALEAQVAQRERSVQELQEAAAKRGAELSAARERAAALDASVTRLQDEVAESRESLEVERREVARRFGIRWWLALPLIRLRAFFSRKD